MNQIHTGLPTGVKVQCFLLCLNLLLKCLSDPALGINVVFMNSSCGLDRSMGPLIFTIKLLPVKSVHFPFTYGIHNFILVRRLSGNYVSNKYW